MMKSISPRMPCDPSMIGKYVHLDFAGFVELVCSKEEHSQHYNPNYVGKVLGITTDDSNELVVSPIIDGDRLFYYVQPDEVTFLTDDQAMKYVLEC